MPVELEPYRRVVRPVNRHDCVEGVLRWCPTLSMRRKEKDRETPNREHRHRGVLLTMAPCASGTRDASTSYGQTAETPTFAARGALCESYRTGTGGCEARALPGTTLLCWVITVDSGSHRGPRTATRWAPRYQDCASRLRSNRCLVDHAGNLEHLVRTTESTGFLASELSG